jgi:hypothetical protein
MTFNTRVCVIADDELNIGTGRRSESGPDTRVESEMISHAHPAALIMLLLLNMGGRNSLV